nr:unnamed protein product [Callosobruchus chinensis]
MPPLFFRKLYCINNRNTCTIRSDKELTSIISICV